MDTEWKDVHLSFDNWSFIQEQYGTDNIDDYYLNGYGVEGLVKAVLFDEKIDTENEEIYYKSKGDTCYIHFATLDMAARVAERASSIIKMQRA